MFRLWFVLALVGMLSATSVGSAHAQVTTQQTYSGDFSGGAGTAFSPRFSGPITLVVNWATGTFTCSVDGSGRASGEGWTVTADVIGSTCSGSIDRASGRLEGAFSASAAVSYVDRNPEYNESSTETNSGSIVGAISPADGSGSGTFIEGIFAWTASGPPASAEPVEFAGNWSNNVHAPSGLAIPSSLDVTGTIALTLDPVKRSLTCKVQGGGDHPDGIGEQFNKVYAVAITTEECQASLTEPPPGTPGQPFTGPLRLQITITHDPPQSSLLAFLGFSTTSSFVQAGEISGTLRENFGSGEFAGATLSSSWSAFVQDTPLTADTFGVVEYKGSYGIQAAGGFPPMAGEIQFRLGRGTRQFRCGLTGQGVESWTVERNFLINWAIKQELPYSREGAAMVLATEWLGPGDLSSRFGQVEEIEVQAKVVEVKSCHGEFDESGPIAGELDATLQLDFRGIFPDGSSLTQTGIPYQWFGRISGRKSEADLLGDIRHVNDLGFMSLGHDTGGGERFPFLALAS